MADIEQYLTDFLTLDTKISQSLDLPTSSTEALQKASNPTYKLLDDSFLIKSKSSNKEMLQYATFYWLRLQSLKPFVKEFAEIKWERDQIEYVNNILDIKPNVMTCIIGTLFKEMPLKPSILKNVLGIIGTKKFQHGLYVSEEDYAVLEDSSGRIRIKKGVNFNPDHFVTGCIIGLKGVVDTNGFFEVMDYCYAGIPFQNPMPKIINLDLKRGLYDDLNDKREFVAFVSGIEFGQPNQIMSTELLLRFLRGELNGPRNLKLASLISRVVICGNSIVQPEDADQVLRGSYRVQSLNQRVYKSISEVLDSFERFIDKLSTHMDVDIMSGDSDFSSSFLPQQPLNSCLFPQLQDQPSINLVTNPHKFELNGLTFLGCSGQNLNDIYSYTKGTVKDNDTRLSPIDALQMTLEMRHICPTAPDTLRAYPQLEEDPFIIDSAPHVYFAGNQEYFMEKFVEVPQNNKASKFIQGVKLISVPSFNKTRSIVLLDLSSLQTYEVKFDLSEGVMPVRDSAMEMAEGEKMEIQ